MPFEIRWTERAEGDYAELRAAAEQQRAKRLSAGKTKSTKAEGLFKQVAKTIQLLGKNPKHPGLQTHQYHSLPNPFGAGKVFEAYAQNKIPGSYRVFWCYGPENKQITIIAITPHP